MQVWIPLVSALFAALVGAWINDRFRRPRLRLIPTSLRLSTAVIPRGSVIEPDSDLITLCSENPYVPAPPFLAAGKVDEQAYVSYLTRVLDIAQTSVRVEFPAIAKRAQQLQAKLGADDFEGVARLWAREQYQLWPAIEGPYIRREFTFDELPEGANLSNDGGASAASALDYETAELPEGAILISQMAPPYTVLVFNPNMARSGAALERSKDLARRLAVAFATGRKPDLIRVFNIPARAEERSPALENLRQKIEVELARLKRLSVTALISNTGGTPVSISNPRCSMTLHVSGYAYRVGEGDEARQFVQRDDRDLQLQLVDDLGQPRPPVVIEAGGVEAILGVYDETLSAEPLADGGSLYDLVRSSLEGSERAWTLAVQAVLPRNPSKTIKSRRVSFQDLKEPDRKRQLAEPQSVIDRAGLERTITERDNELSATRAEISKIREYVAALEIDRLRLLEILSDPSQQRPIPSTLEGNGPRPPDRAPQADQM